MVFDNFPNHTLHTESSIEALCHIFYEKLCNDDFSNLQPALTCFKIRITKFIYEISVFSFSIGSLLYVFLSLH